MTADSDDYENGVADLLRGVVASSMEISVREHLPAFDSGGVRELDVVARGPIAGSVDGLLVVDCKRYSRRIDVNDAGKFVALVKDVRADIGLLISSSTFSDKALRLLKNERGVRTASMSLEDLERFQPAGTMTWTVELPTGTATSTLTRLRRSGLRTWVRDDGFEPRSGGVLISIAYHPGSSLPREEAQARASDMVLKLLQDCAPDHDVRASGIVIGGGLPGSRWLNVTIDGVPTDLKVLASTEEELRKELDNIAISFGFPIDQLDAARPFDWPLPPFLKWIGLS